eukprot:CAMPEP_0197644264 /NCGR_PEP_ID=MMETSP1338-20131121/17299_1 /TAXON_ID=43686 ORGANISM="Pelagodinium beii, Strain RCC1491" /NCGR_SAMPLE_ID=MMETSP1338 /ASSEMBLY_ACC=CAM_ASM_000754 /LENGTH=183 /DNA_ID=CAMNT_0043217633 /DNA_START=42 /DNA_END=593 /DNA_ORIENTATION=+
MQFSFVALALLACQVSAGYLRTAPDSDVATEVAEDSKRNMQIHIHQDFVKQEQEMTKIFDATKQKKITKGMTQRVVGLDRNGKTEMLIQVGNEVSGPACEKIKCADPLTCPPGFQPTEVDGHCCPYCINRDLKIEPKITGATGKSGGKASAYCKEVWCFPTMCKAEETMPTTSNGLCCPACPE